MISNLLYTSTFNYPTFALIAWTGIFLGILHTIMPCEDKAIFCFYSFGVSRDWKQAFRILNFYGFGLFLMNLVIGVIISYFAAGIGSFLSDKVDRFVWNGVASFSLIISGFIMLYQIYRKKYWPHTEQFQELTESLGTLRARKRTAFLLGLMAGIPPCIFEIAVYVHAMSFAAQYGWGNGVWVVFFFGIGTWFGLIPLAIIGSAGGRINKMLKGTSMRKIFDRSKKLEKQKKQAQIEKLNSDPDNEAELNGEGKDTNTKALEDLEKDDNEADDGSHISKLEFFSAASLIGLGLVFLILALLRVDIFDLSTPRVPAPFNFFQD
jgi:sulfite exporter TauE/SafE